MTILTAAEWKTYQRKGQIEARPWTSEDEYQFVRGNTGRVSISSADRETGKINGLHGGYVARNPDNHEDQWYIAPDYFAKHYASSLSPSAPGVEDRKCPYCDRPAAADGSIVHRAGCIGLEDVRLTRLQYDALASRLSAPAGDGWIEWKPGDAFPAAGNRLVTHIEQNMLNQDMRPKVIEAYQWGGAWRDTESRQIRVIAYWRDALPPPYAPPSGAKGEG